MAPAVQHVVVFVQENHTTDNYFWSMRAWGANIATDWPVQPNPPASDQPHNRAQYAKWLHAQQAGTTSPATHTQFDTVAVLLDYAYLAATGAFLENHCSGFGTNSTQKSPTRRAPSQASSPAHHGRAEPDAAEPAPRQTQPVWDMPSILGHAGDHGRTWKAYTGTSSYPVAFYRQLTASPNIIHSDQIVADAPTLPALSLVWHDSPYDEHPPADVSLGQDKVWQAVDAIVTGATGMTPCSC